METIIPVFVETTQYVQFAELDTEGNGHKPGPVSIELVDYTVASAVLQPDGVTIAITPSARSNTNRSGTTKLIASADGFVAVAKIVICATVNTAIEAELTVVPPP